MIIVFADQSIINTRNITQGSVVHSVYNQAYRVWFNASGADGNAGQDSRILNAEERKGFFTALRFLRHYPDIQIYYVGGDKGAE